MANCRYYAVAGGDIWAMRYASAELAQWINRSKMIAFVNGAVQELGTRGESRPCMRARSRRPPTVGSAAGQRLLLSQLSKLKRPAALTNKTINPPMIETFFQKWVS
jgi:hypothetical protein